MDETLNSVNAEQGAAVEPQSAQENARYAAARRKAESEAGRRIAEAEARSDGLLRERETRDAGQRDWSDFFAYFREEYGRSFDPQKDKIPPEVFDARKGGAKLRDAYINVRVKELKAENEALQKKLQAREINQKNAAGAVGSVKSDGAPGGDFISYDAFEAKKNDQEWLIRNLDRLVKSRERW